ncbi:MAG: hypothetical protein KJ666_08705 [Bacteroidetes bacterium]|nr:hypothetical protein [Bacteroidota bacterium]
MLNAISSEFFVHFTLHINADGVVTARCVARACERFLPFAGLEIHAAASLHIVVGDGFSAGRQTNNTGVACGNPPLARFIKRSFQSDTVSCAGSVVESQLPEVSRAQLVWWRLLELHLHLRLRKIECKERNEKNNDASSFHGDLLLVGDKRVQSVEPALHVVRCLPLL